MKKLFIPLLLMLLGITSCKKVGKVNYKIKFTTSDISLLRGTHTTQDEHYTQFGNYITSLTPSKFIAKIWTIGYTDTVMVPGSNSAQLLQYIDQNPDALSQDDSSRFVDFSNNATVSFTHPRVFGRLRDGILEDASIDFKYFYFMPYYLYQEIQLPAEYENVSLNMFNTSGHATVENNILKTQQQPFIQLAFPNSSAHQEGPYFYFGNTDSTFVANPNGEAIPTSINNPAIGDPTSVLIIRSSKYTNAIYHAPPSGQTITMSGIVSFNTTDLIQVYAGADNIPYTNDDVFVYAPYFWERISSRLDIE